MTAAPSGRAFVPARALETLVALLRLARPSGDRAGFEALQRDRFAGLLAVAVGALVDRLQRLVDLGDQLAEAVAGAQFERAVGLGGRTIREIGPRQALFLHVLQRLIGLLDQLALPLQKLLPEVLLLHRVHERFAVRRPVILRQRNRHRRQLHSQRLTIRLGEGGLLRRAEYRDGGLRRNLVHGCRQKLVVHCSKPLIEKSSQTVRNYGAGVAFSIAAQQMLPKRAVAQRTWTTQRPDRFGTPLLRPARATSPRSASLRKRPRRHSG